MTNCPSREDWLAFHLGKLPESDVDALGEHLEDCPQCTATLEHLEESADPFFDALRHPASIDGLANTRSLLASTQATVEVEVPNLPGYDILDSLGSGGMGVVYKARQQRLNRLVALKQLACRREKDLVRARREAEALAHLQHPNIVQIFEIVEHEGRVYLALELVEGGPLSVHLRGKPQPPEASAQFIATLARAIHYAHLRGIVHRDLKPSNVLLAKNEAPASVSRAAWSGFLPKITDFGVAKQLSFATSETRQGDVIGTPGYMAPEQAGGETGQASPASDVYSLGVLLYELLTGRVPLLDTNVIDTLQRVRNEEPVPPRRLVPRLARDLETICLKCLRKEPGQRYSSAADLAEDLHRFLAHEPIQARPTPRRERFHKWVRRHPATSALTAGILFTVVLSFCLIAWQWRRAEDKAVLAQDREAREKEARVQIQRLVARNTLSEGINLCENGEIERGLLWMVHALEMAEANGDSDLDRAARWNLAAWRPQLVRLQADMAHNSWIWTVAFSPDGRTLATGSYDQTARLWDLEGKPRSQPLQHHYPVWSVVFSRDGQTLLTGSGEEAGGEVRLWNVSNGQLLGSWSQAKRVIKVRFNPTASSCLIVSETEAVLRSLPDGKVIGQPLKHSSSSPSTANSALIGEFSSDGKLIATAGPDNKVRFWDAATGAAQKQILEVADAVRDLAFSPDGRILLTGGRDGNARMWEVASGKPSSLLLTHQGPILATAFSPDGKIAATAGIVHQKHFDRKKRTLLGGEVRLWRVPTGEALSPPLPHAAPVWSLAFSPNGRRLLTGCEDASANLYLVATCERIAKFPSRSGTVTQVAFSPSGNQCLLSGAGGGTPIYARLWQVAPEDSLPRVLLHQDTVDVLQFNPDGRVLLSGGADHLAQLWDVATGSAQGFPLAHEHDVVIAAFSRDGRSLFTTSEEIEGTKGLVYDAALWDLSEGRKRLALKFPHHIFCACFCENDRELLVGDDEGNLQRYDVSSGKPIEAPLKQKSSVFSLELRADERILLTGGEGGAVLWDWKTRQRLKELPWGSGGVQAYFYPDGRRVLLEQNGFAQDWDHKIAKRIGSPLFHAEGGIVKLAFSPDGQSVLICDKDGRSRLWDVATGQRIGPAPGDAGIDHIAFSPSGRHLAVSDRRGKVALWAVPQPMPGQSDRLRLWAETLAGMELDSQQVTHHLDPDEILRRRARLDEMGGPPADR